MASFSSLSCVAEDVAAASHGLQQSGCGHHQYTVEEMLRLVLWQFGAAALLPADDKGPVGPEGGVPPGRGAADTMPVQSGDGVAATGAKLGPLIIAWGTSKL